jgi:hypothetical protein
MERISILTRLRRLVRTAGQTRDAALQTRYMIVIHAAAGKTRKEIAAERAPAS